MQTCRGFFLTTEVFLKKVFSKFLGISLLGKGDEIGELLVLFGTKICSLVSDYE